MTLATVFSALVFATISGKTIIKGLAIIVGIIFVLYIIGCMIDNIPDNPSDNQKGNNPPPVRPVAEPVKPLVKSINDLKSVEDVQYELSEIELRQIKTVKNVIARTNISVKQRYNLDFDFDKIEQLIRLANNLVNNTAHANNINSKYKYYTELWFRSYIASTHVEKAERLIKDKLNYLHKINFDNVDKTDRSQIIELQAELPKLLSMIVKYKQALYNNNHRLKLAIRDSGWQGYSWYQRLEERIAQKKAV